MERLLNLVTTAFFHLSWILVWNIELLEELLPLTLFHFSVGSIREPGNYLDSSEGLYLHVLRFVVQVVTRLNGV